jgi:excisionase family DNA binding protein
MVHKERHNPCDISYARLSWLFMEGDYYTTGEAARILGVTETRIRQLLLSKELEGTRDPMTERWRIPQHAVHARKEQRRPTEPPRLTADAREWIERVNELERELGRVEGEMRAQTQLTETTESTLRESLERERERADKLEAELREERSKGFWARLFGR